MGISDSDLGRYVRSDYPRRVRIVDNLTISMAGEVAAEFRRLDNESDEVIVVEFTSDGGVHEAAAMLAVENILVLRSPTLGIVYGKCFSAGMTVLQMCTWRYALPSARFIMHNNYASLKVTPNLDPEDAYDQLKILIARVKATREHMIGILSSRLKHITPGELIKILDHADEDGPIWAIDALSKGMIDGIIHTTAHST